MIRAIVIDDEQDSRNTLLEILQSKCPDIQVAAEASDVKSGIRSILANQPDLVFLDIQMPDGTGFDLLEMLPEIRFRIIFTTAYDQFALRAIKFSALDYLLKPVDPEQLTEAVRKYVRLNDTLQSQREQIDILFQNKHKFNRIALPTSEGYRFVKIDDIVRCQSDSNYTLFYFVSG